MDEIGNTEKSKKKPKEQRLVSSALTSEATPMNFMFVHEELITIRQELLS